MISMETRTKTYEEKKLLTRVGKIKINEVLIFLENERADTFPNRKLLKVVEPFRLPLTV